VSHRRQLNATIVASYVIACLALGLCLDRVLKLYESTVEATENAQLERILNREVSDAAWREYASSAVGLARDVTQDSEASRLFQSKDPKFGPASQDLLRRSSVTSGAMGILGFGAMTMDGDVFISEGDVPINDADLNAQALISQRKGVDRAKVLTCVWLFHGRPVLTVIYPIGGLRPVGYFILHTDPLSALATLDE
jgi:hypothetical protein